MKQIIALQQYTDKYISLYQGEIRNISDTIANKLIEEGIVAEHDQTSPGGSGHNSGNNVFFIEARKNENDEWILTQKDSSGSKPFNPNQDHENGDLFQITFTWTENIFTNSKTFGLIVLTKNLNSWSGEEVSSFFAQFPYFYSQNSSLQMDVYSIQFGQTGSNPSFVAVNIYNEVL